MTLDEAIWQATVRTIVYSASSLDIEHVAADVTYHAISSTTHYAISQATQHAINNVVSRATLICIEQAIKQAVFFTTQDVKNDPR